MYYAMGFKIEYSKTFCFAVRAKPFKNFESAKLAIERAKLKGYVQKQGQAIPVWENVL